MLGLLAVLLAGIGLRFWIASQPGIGHDGDLGLFVRWIRGLHEHGLGGFYAAERFCDYPPLMLLMMRGLGGVIFAFVEDPGNHAFRFGVKILAGIGDLAIGLLLLQEGRRMLGFRAGVLAGGLYLLNPVAVHNSAYWGQVDAIYTALLLGSLVLLRRRRWAGAGFAIALSLTAKFQAIAILPLVLFETYRLARARGLLRACTGGLVGVALIAVPFVLTGTLREMVDRAYIGVIGQYHEMSNNAYNLWFLIGQPKMPDTSPPDAIVRAVSQGRDHVNVAESWLLRMSWRTISLALFALSVAVVLSLYARRPGEIARYGAAGLLALCFYLFPTEMHERYAYPAIAFLALWAAAHPRNERLYWALTIALLLNLVTVLPIKPLAPQIAAANLVLFAGILAGLALPRSTRAPAHLPPAHLPPAQLPPAQLPPATAAESLPWPIRGFQVATVAAVVFAVGIACFAFWSARSSSKSHADASPSANVVWLAELTPESAQQGWKTPGFDRAAEGGPIRIGDDIYMRGVGTHAPATLVYAVPEGSDSFEAIVGIDHVTGGKGSVVLRVELDGVERFASQIITADSGGLPVRLDVTGGSILTIRLDPTDDGRRFDHVDLALARFTMR